MDNFKLAAGDSNKSPRLNVSQAQQARQSDSEKSLEENKINDQPVKDKNEEDTSRKLEITPQVVEENENKLKERIAQCRNIIESLKVELSKEKSKLETETKAAPQQPSVSDNTREISPKPDILLGDVYSYNMYSASVDSKLNCDESLIEYEKQLQKYQNTLNMAQLEKKNAIRKQMLAKAFKLKLLEVENQCNIELLRVKQSLQCLEPLKMIANKWKTTPNDNMYDLNNYELIPRFPELSFNSSYDINSFKEDCETKSPPEKSGMCATEDTSPSDC